jgi:hypothetical protein
MGLNDFSRFRFQRIGRPSGRSFRWWHQSIGARVAEHSVIGWGIALSPSPCYILGGTGDFLSPFCRGFRAISWDFQRRPKRRYRRSNLLEYWEQSRFSPVQPSDRGNCFAPNMSTS